LPRELEGWRSLQGRGRDGSIESDQRVSITRPVVDEKEGGARRLGERYWAAVARAARGLVRPRETARGVELCLAGHGPCLLRFGPGEQEHDRGQVSCSFPIRGGLLARKPAGAICLSQTPGELRAAVTGFVPRLRALYGIQRRLHVAVSRRYFRSLLEDAS
jgi:hypothetical protein